MKVIIEVPDSDLSPSVQDMIKRQDLNSEEKRAIVYECLIIATNEFYRSRITTDQYRLVI